MVRLATLDDVEFLAEGNARMAWETEALTLDGERLRRGVAAVFEDPARGFYLIAEVDGQKAAQMMITYEWSDWRNGVFWWIQSVYTVPELRGRGAFKALYAEAERMAREAGNVCGLRLYVEAHNEAAKGTYRRCGMRETEYRMYEVDRVVARE
ncbi:MAG: GNAT family N-acetyltransferase [Bryobacterales bacterium]|nr:GNAT family N-acetyltransferase [Bryobacterales bacterium]